MKTYKPKPASENKLVQKRLARRAGRILGLMRRVEAMMQEIDALKRPAPMDADSSRWLLDAVFALKRAREACRL